MTYLKNVLFLLVIVSAITTGKENGDALFRSDSILTVMKNVCNYQIENPSRHTSKNRDFPTGWVPSSFYVGVMAAYESTNDIEYFNYAKNWADLNNYETGPRLRHADDHCCGQIYCEIYMETKNQDAIKKIQAVYDEILLGPGVGKSEWWWCDALFMSPPTLVRLFNITGDDRYLELMHEMYWSTVNYLFDQESNLFIRDDSYFDKRSKNGKKIYWSRGNGWVIAGLARIIPHLDDNDPFKQKYIDLFKKMAESLKDLQGEDGLWRSSLHDPDEFPNPETSGSGFISFAMTWGINNNYLDRESYLPVVKLAWQGLNSAVHENGKIGWVQQIGKSPEDVQADETQAYGAGAFLLVGSELLKLVTDKQ